MTAIDAAGTYRLGDRTVRRMGYGAMQLAGPHVFGPPRDRAACVAVLREAVASGVDHIDTSDFYGPHITNDIIREALHPYPDELVIVTKVGAARGSDGSWNPAQSPAELAAAVDDNLRNLRLDVIEVVNLRIVDAASQAPTEGSIGARVEALAALQAAGKIRHIGISNVTPAQVAEARTIAPVACVQNLYNIANRGDDALIDGLAADGIAYVPYFPLGGFSPLQSSVTLGGRDAGRGNSAAGCAGVAAGAVAEYFVNSRDVVAGPPARKYFSRRHRFITGGPRRTRRDRLGRRHLCHRTVTDICERGAGASYHGSPLSRNGHDPSNLPRDAHCNGAGGVDRGCDACPCCRDHRCWRQLSGSPLCQVGLGL